MLPWAAAACRRCAQGRRRPAAGAGWGPVASWGRRGAVDQQAGMQGEGHTHGVFLASLKKVSLASRLRSLRTMLAAGMRANSGRGSASSAG